MTKHYSPVHQGTLTNHLPMYQQALRSLEIPEDSIIERSTIYIEERAIKDLEDKTLELTEFEKVYLIQVEKYKDLLKMTPIDQVISTFLVDKKESMASGLFHGMIRLSFAAKNGDMEELARSLAYFDCVAEPMSIDCGGGISSKPKDAWNDLMKLREKTEISFKDGPIMSKIAVMGQDKALMAKVTELEILEDSEKRVSFILANWYMKTRDFYVLHVITGYQALLELKPYIKDFDQWLNTYWQMAQMFSLFTRERLPIIKISVKPWAELIEEAQTMTDVHDVKLFYACRDLYERYELKVFNKIAHIVSHKYWGREHH